ncbi:cytochrome c biogenesis protein CcdA [bacterium]|nr:cytochrome c biogenesis protein CcdA [bacterium]
MNLEIGIFSAFFAGVISFLSPCVLPLVPAYLSFLAGASLEEIKGDSGKAVRKKILLTAVAFVAGFTVIFVAMGASATFLGKWFSQNVFWLGKLAGLLLVVLGLHLTGIIRIPFLMVEKRMRVQSQGMNMGKAFIVGAAFAFGWSPCIGPLLAGILALAGTQDTVGKGIFLLIVYSLGLGIPFILAAAAVERFLSWSQKFRRYMRWIEIIAGGLLMMIGVVMMMGAMMRVSSWFSIFGRFGF